MHADVDALVRLEQRGEGLRGEGKGFLARSELECVGLQQSDQCDLDLHLSKFLPNAGSHPLSKCVQGALPDARLVTVLCSQKALLHNMKTSTSSLWLTFSVSFTNAGPDSLCGCV